MTVNKKARYVVYLIGLASDSVGNVTIDRQVWLYQVHKTSGIALVPLGTSPQLSYEKALFFADCLSYDHDIPSFIEPSALEFRKQGYTFLLGKVSRKLTREWYFHDLVSAWELARDLRHGSLAYIEFRWGHPDLQIDLPYTANYEKAEKELHLYATALKQIDPLSEYLCLYRVLESVHGSNVKTWVANNLDKIRNFNFGDLAYGVDWERQGDVFSKYKQRALCRLANLRKILSTDQEIANYYLYKEIRCGIAHGKEKIKRYDFGSDFFSIAKDSYILKLLARISIDEKIGLFAPVVVS